MEKNNKTEYRLTKQNKKKLVCTCNEKKTKEIVLHKDNQIITLVVFILSSTCQSQHTQ
jgi:hypothetical protein